jgi:hypothetical protein
MERFRLWLASWFPFPPMGMSCPHCGYLVEAWSRRGLTARIGRHMRRQHPLIWQRNCLKAMEVKKGNPF